MRRATLLGAITIVFWAMLACGGSTNNQTRPRGSTGGSPGTGGSTGGSLGSGGRGSPGTATIEFSIVGSYCMTMECTGPTIDIQDLSGNSLFNVGAMPCDADCDTCQVYCAGACPPPSGIVVTGATLEWDGGYSTRSTCGGGTSCLARNYVSKGRYIAKMCATPGEVVGSDGGPPQCVASGPPKCGQVEFDFPSKGIVTAQVP